MHSFQYQFAMTIDRLNGYVRVQARTVFHR